MKLWDTERGVCTRTYRSHVNDKNFVDLTVTKDSIACGESACRRLVHDIYTHTLMPCSLYPRGSENNAVYVYTKQVSNAMLTYHAVHRASGDIGEDIQLKSDKY